MMMPRLYISGMNSEQKIFHYLRQILKLRCYTNVHINVMLFCIILKMIRLSMTIWIKIALYYRCGPITVSFGTSPNLVGYESYAFRQTKCGSRTSFCITSTSFYTRATTTLLLHVPLDSFASVLMAMP